MLMSRRKFAAHVGLSHTRINKLVNDGVIPLHDGKIELNEGKRLMKENEDPARDAQREANAKRRGIGGVFSETVLPEKSVADLSESEKKEYTAKLLEETQKALKAKEDAKKAGVVADDIDIPINLNEAKLFREYYMGKTAELLYLEKRGELLPESEVLKDVNDAITVIRNNFTNLSSKISSKLGLDKKQENIIDQEVMQILEHLSRLPLVGNS